MRVEIEPSRIEGEVGAPPSKSLGIRYVLLSLLTEVSLEQLPDSDDVKVATKVVQDLREGREELYLGGSATTLRMIIPILLAMGRKMKLDGDETLRRRPLRALKSLSAKFSSFNLPLTVEGHLNEEVEIEGWESSQYVSGLIYALCLKGGGRIKLIPPISSKGYIYMTADVIRAVNGEVRFQDNVIEVRCGKLSKFRGKVPGDYALASFYAVGAILTGGKVRISNLYPPPNYVGDHVIVEMLRESGAKSQVNQDTWTVEYRGQVRPLHVSINDVPDLAPSLAGLMALGSGESIMEDVERLRLKESDRIATILDTLSRFGIRGSYDAGKITVTGGNPRRGEVECPNDHRIAMMAGDLALKAGGSVSRAECVRKSNPRFWTDISSLGGKLTLKGS